MVDFKVSLDIPDIEILKIERNRTEDFIITVRSTKTSTACRNCGKEAKKIHGYGETIILRHLTILGQRVYIRIKPSRYECENCDDHPTTTVLLEIIIQVLIH